MHHAQGLHDPARDLLFGTALHPQPKGYVVAHAHVREKGVILKDGVDLPPFRGDVVHPSAADEHFPGIRALKTGKDAQDRGLATAGRPEQGQKFAIADAQIDVFQRAGILKGFVHAPQFDDAVLSGHASRLPPCPCCRRPHAGPKRSPSRRKHTAPKRRFSQERFRAITFRRKTSSAGGAPGKRGCPLRPRPPQPQGRRAAQSRGPCLSRILYMSGVKGSRKAPRIF